MTKKSLFWWEMNFESIYNFFNKKKINEKIICQFYDKQSTFLVWLKNLDSSNSVFKHYWENKNIFFNIATEMLNSIMALRGQKTFFSQIFNIEKVQSHYVFIRSLSVLDNLKWIENDNIKIKNNETKKEEDYWTHNNYTNNKVNTNLSLINDIKKEINWVQIKYTSSKEFNPRKNDVYNENAQAILKEIYKIQEKAFNRIDKEFIHNNNLIISPHKMLARLTVEFNDLFPPTLSTTDYLWYIYLHSLISIYWKKPIYKTINFENENIYMNKAKCLEILEDMYNKNEYIYNNKIIPYTKEHLKEIKGYFTDKNKWKDRTELKKYNIENKLSKIMAVSDYIKTRTNLDRWTLYWIISDDDTQTKEHLQHFILIEILLDLDYIKDSEKKKWEFREVFFRKGNYKNITMLDLREILNNAQIQNIHFFIYRLPKKQYKDIDNKKVNELIKWLIFKNSLLEIQTEEQENDISNINIDAINDDLEYVELWNYENLLYNFILEKYLWKNKKISIW